VCRTWISSLILLLVALPLTAAGAGTWATIEPGIEASLTEDLRIEVVVYPRAAEAWSRLAQRVTGDGANWKAIAELNGQGKVLLADRPVRVPIAMARPELQRKAMLAIFPRDHATAGGWLHRVSHGNGVEGEPLWKISEWFTGDGANYAQINGYNGRTQLSTRRGDIILIPDSLLRDGFRFDPARPRGPIEPLPVEDDPPLAKVDVDLSGSSAPQIELAVTRSSEPARLEYVRKADRPFAIYRLKKGEALYSSVVIRFTGRIFARDVYEVVDELVAFNRIDDVSKLPVGYAVRIPVELLLPEYRPPDDPRRIEFERAKRESSRLARRVEALNLEGVHVVIDPGHGGRDVGTEHKGVWESSYVYDVSSRLKTLLETTSGAKVYMTTRSKSQGYAIQSRDVLKNYTDHEVLTTPRYDLSDSTVGVNLRWYLANSIYRRVTKSTPAEKVVFLSIHADSLHPSLRGAMAYVPGAQHSQGTFRRSGEVYLARAEVKESPAVTHSEADALHAEGLSMQMAGTLIESFRRSGLEVHPFNPVRSNVVRGGREWVPAIIRYNKIPTRVLIEVCNLGNPRDRELIQTRAFRQQIAEAIFEGLVDYFDRGGADAGAPDRIAMTGR
jgi:N-acetylmuramoyl-L-alanine amidase